MFPTKILFNLYQIGKNLLSGRGLTKYSFIRKVKHYSLSNLQTDYAEVFGNKLFLSKKGLALSISHYGTYEELESKIMEEKIEMGNIVVDVGANIGLHTLNMARIVGNTGQVFAFEPDPSNFEILKKNVKINNYKNIILMSFVLYCADLSAQSVPYFDSNKAFEYINKQCEFGPRYPGSEGYLFCPSL